MKQVELAKRLGISKSYLSMILSGQRKASPEMAMKISSLFFVNSEAKLSLRGRCPRPLDECASLAGYARFPESRRKLFQGASFAMTAADII
jgi:transcriptional regulator with XRE-family HTH domain